MDLQSRKIVFVQEFLKLQSEEAIARLEKLLSFPVFQTIKSEFPINIPAINQQVI